MEKHLFILILFVLAFIALIIFLIKKNHKDSFRFEIGDILETNFQLLISNIQKEHQRQVGVPISDGLASYKVVANIPYYITGQILRQFLESNCQPSSMVLISW